MTEHNIISGIFIIVACIVAIRLFFGPDKYGES